MSWNPGEVLRLVDSLHRDKNIDSEYVFQAIESALVSAARKQYGEESEIVITIDRGAGTLQGSCNGEEIDPEVIGRIGAQTAKQVIIQKIREAERDSLVEEFEEQIGQMVSGVVQRAEGGATTVALGPVEAILPRSEQIPGESHHANERVRAIVYEVRPQGNRVKVVLSRNHPSLVARLFEQEIPEIADGVITVNAMAREPGYRSKVAVSSSDSRVDCVGACVGVRGNRIKNIVDELSGERIDIVRWSDDPEVLIPNSLQPAEVEQVLLCDMIGRAIVLVREDQLSLAIGRRGQNVRLASKLSGWDIEIMTADELEEQIERAVAGFCELEGMTEELAQSLVEQGYLSYDDLEVIEPDALQEMGGLTESQVELIVNQAEVRAREAEVVAAEARRQKKLDRIEEEMRAAAEADAVQSAPPAAETPAEETPAAPVATEEPNQDGDASAT
ncbi:MAG: transcription termination factor NusA [Planctomycetaceae bacterium]|nr:transcription termination factor NusA [Planctomycetales bacterium]MCB9940255.1 transcription termination factor NusA [Planctomycetaceae bacterium]